MKHTLFFYRELVMKYNIEGLQKLKEETTKASEKIGDGLNGLITRTINIKQELSDVENKLLSADKTTDDIVTHMALVKQHKKNRVSVSELLLDISCALKNLYEELETDYKDTVKQFKG